MHLNRMLQIVSYFFGWMDTSAFVSFDGYNFESDEKYQNGVKAIGKDTLETKYFYFSKCIQNFSFDDYRNWKEAQIIHLGNINEKSLSFQEIMSKVQQNQLPPVKLIPDTLHSQSSCSHQKPIKKPWDSLE
jgi:hypothetical protein